MDEGEAVLFGARSEALGRLRVDGGAAVEEVFDEGV